MNSINLTGNVCNDLEIKSTQSGKSVLSFNIAVKRPFTKDITDFFPVTVWGQPAEYLANYGRKGSRVAVTGKLTTRKYTDKSGAERTAYEIVADSVELMESKNEGQSAPSAGGNSYIPDAYTSPKAPEYEVVDADDDLPF